MESNTLSLLTRTLEILSTSQDISKLSASHSLSDYQSYLSTPLNTCFQPSHPIYTNFISEITCQLCQSVRCDIALRCNHHFCLRCIKDSTKILAIDISCLYEDDLTPCCPKCAIPISRVQAESIKQYAKKNNELQSKETFKKCMVCHLFRPQTKFFYACNDICVFCGYHLGVNQSCTVCGESGLNPNTFYYDQVTCKACNKNIAVAEDYATEICNQEIHCYDCLKSAYATGKCKACSAGLDTDTTNYLKDLLFLDCEKCENCVERKFLVKKRCCKPHLCLFCQKLSGDNCGLCSSPLLQSTLLTLKMIPEIDID